MENIYGNGGVDLDLSSCFLCHKMNVVVGAGKIKNPHCLKFPSATHFLSANYRINREFIYILIFLSRDLFQ